MKGSGLRLAVFANRHEVAPAFNATLAVGRPASSVFEAKAWDESVRSKGLEEWAILKRSKFFGKSSKKAASCVSYKLRRVGQAGRIEMKSMRT